MSCDKLYSNPEDLQVVISHSNSILIVEDILLNPTDWYTIEIGLIPHAGTLPDIENISARIFGVKNVVYHSQIKPSSPDRYMGFILIISSLLAVITVFTTVRMAHIKNREEEKKRLIIEIEKQRAMMDEVYKDRNINMHDIGDK